MLCGESAHTAIRSATQRIRVFVVVLAVSIASSRLAQPVIGTADLTCANGMACHVMQGS
jgi:hypothetical protein